MMEVVFVRVEQKNLEVEDKMELIGERLHKDKKMGRTLKPTEETLIELIGVLRELIKTIKWKKNLI